MKDLNNCKKKYQAKNINASDVDDEWLYDVVHYELIPLLEEYWFDETDKLSEWTRKLEDSIR